MNQTPPKLIFVIVISVALLAAICVASLCASLFLHVYADPSVLTSIIGTTGLLIGALVTMLSNTRTQPPGSTQTATTTVPPETAQPTEIKP